MWRGIPRREGSVHLLVIRTPAERFGTRSKKIKQWSNGENVAASGKMIRKSKSLLDTNALKSGRFRQHFASEPTAACRADLHPFI